MNCTIDPAALCPVSCGAAPVCTLFALTTVPATPLPFGSGGLEGGCVINMVCGIMVVASFGIW